MLAGAADEQAGGPVPRLAQQRRVGASPEVLEEGRAGGGRLVVAGLVGHALQPRRHPRCQLSALRIRWSLTAWRVPRCWAHSETRYSSSIQRTARCDALGGRPAGSAVDLVQPGVLQVGDLVHQLPVAGDLGVEPLAAVLHRGEVARDLAQLRGTGLADEPRGDEPPDLGAHVGQGRQGG